MTVNATAMAAAGPAGRTLTQAESERALLYLTQSKNGILGAVKNLSASQWTYKPDPERWSIAEIMDHVLFVLELVSGPAAEKLDATPETPVHPDYQLIDDIIIYRFPDRLNRFPSPMEPGTEIDRAHALERLDASYSRLAQRLETAPGLRCHGLPAAPLKLVSGGVYEVMDGYQWIIAAAAHTERHTKQVLEVIAGAGFPS